MRKKKSRSVKGGERDRDIGDSGKAVLATTAEAGKNKARKDTIPRGGEGGLEPRWWEGGGGEGEKVRQRRREDSKGWSVEAKKT